MVVIRKMIEGYEPLTTIIANEGGLPEEKAKQILANLVALMPRDCLLSIHSIYINQDTGGVLIKQRNPHGLDLSCPPEAMCATSFDVPKANSWALGVIFFHLITSRWPYGEPTRENIRNGEVQWENGTFSFDADQFLFNLLQKSPHARPTVDQLTKTTYLNGSRVLGTPSSLPKHTKPRRTKLPRSFRWLSLKISSINFTMCK